MQISWYWHICATGMPADVKLPIFAEASENECGRSHKARKHSRGSVKDRPADHPTFDAVIDHRLCGRRAAVDADEPSVRLQLASEFFRRNFGCALEHDHIVGRA